MHRTTRYFSTHPVPRFSLGSGLGCCLGTARLLPVPWHDGMMQHERVAAGKLHTCHGLTMCIHRTPCPSNLQVPCHHSLDGRGGGGPLRRVRNDVLLLHPRSRLLLRAPISLHMTSHPVVNHTPCNLSTADATLTSSAALALSSRV
jgi:hypothetical protein